MREARYCHHCGAKLPLEAGFCPSCGVYLGVNLPEGLNPDGLKRPAVSRRRFGYGISRNLRWALFFFFMGVFIVGLTVGTYATMSTSDATSLRNDVNSGIDYSSFTSLAESIAMNNIILCMVFFVPVFGGIFMGLISYNTGLVLAADAIYYSVSRPVILLNIFTYPSTWLETVVYSLAASEGIIFLFSITNGSWRIGVKRLLLTVIACILILTVSAVIETSLII
jgi:hypothetical protein